MDGGFVGLGRSRRLLALRPSCRLDSCRCSLRCRARHLRHSDQVARQHGELELLIDSNKPAKHGLTDPPHGLAPAKVLFDTLANRLAQRVTEMACRARVDRTAP